MPYGKGTYGKQVGRPPKGKAKVTEDRSRLQAPKSKKSQAPKRGSSLSERIEDRVRAGAINRGRSRLRRG